MLPLAREGKIIYKLEERASMNLYEQLLVGHERLEGIGAHDDSMDLLDQLLQNTEPAREDKTNISQVQPRRHILHMRPVIDNYNACNDLQRRPSERDESEIAAHRHA